MKVASWPGSTICPTGCVVIDGVVVMVMDADAPLMAEVQFASLTPKTLSTVDAESVTERDPDGELTLWEKPSDQRTVQGPTPVSVNGMVTVEEAQALTEFDVKVIVGPEVMGTSALPLALQPLETVTAM